MLTYKEFAAKLRDLFEHNRRTSLKDVELLKVGRHFRFGKNKIIVGRNETENKLLTRMKMAHDYCFETQNCGSPISLLQGPKTRNSIEKAAELTAYYSDKKQGKVQVKFGKQNLEKALTTRIPQKEEVEQLRIT